MASDRLPVERLRQYLRELPQAARTLLITELERGLASGKQMPAADLILDELRSLETGQASSGARVGDPKRMFFEAFEPFFSDDAPDRKHKGRIARASLDPLWDWICRDICPAESKAYLDEGTRCLARQDAAGAERLARDFQDRVARRIEEAFAAVQRDEKATRRIAAQVGTPHAMDDVRELLALLKARDALATIGARLPSSLKVLADDTLESVKAVLDSNPARAPEVFLYALLLVMGRLSSPWQLIRLAVKAAESDVAARVAETPYAMAVSIVLVETERLVHRLRTDLKQGRTASTLVYLKDIHDAARGLRSELDLSGDSPWGRQLAAIRTDVSELLRMEVESLPGRVRRFLRPRPAKEIAPGTVVDPGDVEETEAAIELLGACRNYASELAMNEAALRVYSDLQNYLDTGTPALLDSLRNSSPSERAFRASQVDAAVRFSSKLFGPNYASLLAKAAEVATHSERKAAKS